MSIVRVIVFWVLACSLFLLLITATLGWEVNNMRLYEYGFDKYEISQSTGIDRPELTKVARNLIDYFNSKSESAQILVSGGEQDFNLFNERELIHLKDVKGLVQLDYWVLGIVLWLIIVFSLVLSLWSKTGWKELIRALFWGSVITLGIMAFLALWSLLGFEKLFIVFHQVSFSNEYWMLDPRTDYLIRLFPGGFFYDAALLWFGAVIFEAIFIGGIAFGVLKYVGGWNSEAK